MIQQGATYRFSFQAPGSENFTVRLDEVVPQALTLGGDDVTVPVQTGGRWFTFTPTVSQIFRLTAESSGGNGDEQIMSGVIYTNTMEWLAEDEEAETVNMVAHLTAGKTYYIVIGVHGAENITVRINTMTFTPISLGNPATVNVAQGENTGLPTLRLKLSLCGIRPPVVKR
jgi:hypothetical protein